VDRGLDENLAEGDAQKRLFVESILQSLTSLKFRLFGSGDLNGFPRSGIAAFTRGPIGNTEISKSNQMF